LKSQAQVFKRKKREPLIIEPMVHSRKFKNFLNICEEHIWRKVILGTPYLWMLLFFVLPFLYVIQISLTEAADLRPPYSTMFKWIEDSSISIRLVFDNYLVILEDDLYIISYLNALRVAFLATLTCLVIGYIMAYGISQSSRKWRTILLLAVIMPFWSSFLLRVYAWMGLLGNHGILNSFLLWIGLIDEPLQIMYTNTSMFIVFVYAYLPFMVLPLYANLEKLDMTMNEAAADLGSKPITVFLTITLPLSVPGIVAGCMLTFIPAIGEFVVPTLVGGPESLMIGRVLYNEFFGNIDWPLASAVASLLLIVLVIPFMLFEHFNSKLETRYQ